MAQQERGGILLTDEVRELVALMKDADIAEVLIERGDAKLHLKRATPPAPAAISVPVYSTPLPAGAPIVAAAPTGATSTGPVEAGEVEETAGTLVTAPMVGTYYASSSPKDPPYVRIGDEVKPGDVLGIIEAMKIMNEIECEVHGRVAQIMVQNAQPIEYGQPLMLIEPL